MNLAEQFDRDGIVIIENFLTDVELAPVRASMARFYDPIERRAKELMCSADSRMTAFECDVVPWDPVAEGDEAFCALANCEKLSKVTKEAMGQNFITKTSLVMFSVAGGRGQAWHQDCPADDHVAYNVNRQLYTEDVNLDNGAIVVVPGSHKLGRIPRGGNQEPIEGEVALTPKAGTLVLLNGHVYHRVTPNFTDKPRNSVNFRAYPEGVDPRVTCLAIYRNGTMRFCDGPHSPLEDAEWEPSN